MNMLKTALEIKNWLDLQRIQNYSIQCDLSVDVDGSVLFNPYVMEHFPVQFGVVKGDFDCNQKAMLSLKGAPRSVGGYFSCFGNRLTSLEYCPSVTKTFDCSDNQLTSLNYAPHTVNGDFNCSDNLLVSLQGAPQTITGDFNCKQNSLVNLLHCPQKFKSFFCNNNKLVSLSAVPQTIYGSFYCSDNQLETLKGGPVTVLGNFNCNSNQLTNLEFCPHSTSGDFYCNLNQFNTLEFLPVIVAGIFNMTQETRFEFLESYYEKPNRFDRTFVNDEVMIFQKLDIIKKARDSFNLQQNLSDSLEYKPTSQKIKI